jgi:D-hydroxyproline dehydrogenase
MSPTTAHIVGGGFIGLACALELQAAGWPVHLYDPGPQECAASYGNAGHIATEQLAPLASWSNILHLPAKLYSLGGPAAFPLTQWHQWLPFGLRLMAAAQPARFARSIACNRTLLARTLPAWRELLARIGQAGLLREAGHAVVWESERSARRGMQAWLDADTGTCSAQALSADQLQHLQRLFANRPIAGLHFTGSAHLHDLVAARVAMRDEFLRAGGVWHAQAVDSVALHSGHAQLLIGGQHVGASDELILIAAGARSPAILRDAFGAIPLIAERGYHLQFDAASGSDGLDYPVVFEDRHTILTPFAQGWRMASFTEFGSSDAPADLRKWQRLSEYASALGLPAAHEGIGQWMGARPTFPDYMPVIGRSQRAGNLMVAFGHHHLGLTLAAVTARLVRDLAMRAPSPVDISALAPQRYIAGF